MQNPQIAICELSAISDMLNEMHTPQTNVC